MIALNYNLKEIQKPPKMKREGNRLKNPSKFGSPKKISILRSLRRLERVFSCSCVQTHGSADVSRLAHWKLYLA